MQDLEHEGTVFNIQKYSVHDGPGIRTIVFLKGCPLSCRWCSNPESQKAHPELAYNAGRCLTFSKCGHCIKACPHSSITRGEDDKPVIDRSHCTSCDLPCVEICPAQGLLAYGKKRTVKDVIKTVEQDAAFYCRSGGGMTISGGEPLFQIDFSLALLRAAKAKHIKTAIETCGAAPVDHILQAAPYLNNVLFDIKHMDSDTHREHTGQSNERILENFAALVSEFPDLPVLARTPVIPGFNDNEDTVSAIAEFIRPYKNVHYELLPYHRLGTQKYIFLDREPPMGEVTLPKETMPPLQRTAEAILGDRLRVPK